MKRLIKKLCSGLVVFGVIAFSLYKVSMKISMLTLHYQVSACICIAVVILYTIISLFAVNFLEWLWSDHESKKKE